jgi:hypothetical protein
MQIIIHISRILQKKKKNKKKETIWRIRCSYSFGNKTCCFLGYKNINGCFGWECFAGYKLAVGFFVGFEPEDGRDMLLSNLELPTRSYIAEDFKKPIAGNRK